MTADNERRRPASAGHGRGQGYVRGSRKDPSYLISGGTGGALGPPLDAENGPWSTVVDPFIKK